ncbi:MAG: molybdopterin-dependent oxidoreductase [bacterium]|nr:molybdopterin-dependent oxidoreductase [bacterium]
MPDEPTTTPVPPGQRTGNAFPRFGAAFRPVPEVPGEPRLRITGAVEETGEIGLGELAALPRREQVSNLHCVTTWTKRDLRWSGWRLADLYRRLIVPRFRPTPEARWLVLYGLDGYRCSLLLEDALEGGVLVADELDGEPLSPYHGAPLRVVSPRQYAYKSMKHLSGIALRAEPARPPLGLEHRRGRVALQERHASLPAWLVRLPYRALIGPTAYLQGRGLGSHHLAGRPTLLDEVMPQATSRRRRANGTQHHELHHLWLDASPAAAYRALGEVTGREIRLLMPLMALRQLPALLTGRARRGDREMPIFEAIERGGFARIAEDPGREMVFGVVGRFWKLTRNTPIETVRDLDGFTSFDRPGSARAAMSFLVRAEGRGCRLITETRIDTTDARAARSFRRYWRIVRPGSGLIRRSWLAAVRRRLARE